MSLKEEVELLRQIPLFAGIEPSKLKLIAFTSERVTFDAGHVLFRHHDAADAAYVVIEGEAEVLVDGPTGPVLVARMTRNAVVGEMGILCDVPRTATVRAAERLVCLRIGKDEFIRMINEFPQIAMAVIREIAARLERSTENLRQALVEVEKLRRPPTATAG